MRVTLYSALLGIGAALTLLPRQSEACSIAPVAIGILSASIPADGVLPISLYCSSQVAYCDNPASAFEVFDAAGNVVAGTIVEQLRQPKEPKVTLAWVPASGWAVGSTYQFHVNTTIRNDVQTFAVVPSVSPDAVSLTATLNVIAEYGEGVACGTTETTCGMMEQQFYPNIAQVASLSLQLDAGSTWSAQSVLSVRGLANSGSISTVETGVLPVTPEWSVFSTNRLPELYFKEQASEYCYQVVARKLGQSSTTVVSEGCLPHGDLPALGHIDDISQYRLDSCTGPAAGYEALWCQWADEAELCGAEKRAAFPEQCAEYDRVCVTTPSTTSNGNAASGSGCQFTAAGNTRSGWSLLLAGLAAFAFTRRRARANRNGR